MGQSFGTIMIKRIDFESSNEIDTVTQILQTNFIKEKEDLSYHDFLTEKWNRPSEGIIGLFYNDFIIIIEDEYEIIKNEFIEELSKKLNTEIACAILADTAGISMIKFFDKGKLIRMKSLGLENDIAMLSGIELKAVEGIGEKTQYERNGSDALNVFTDYIEGKVEAHDINSMTIYKAK